MINKAVDLSTQKGVGVTGIKVRQKMVDALNINNADLKIVMSNTPRHYFIDQAFYQSAYIHNRALPIGFSQTISPAAVVAQMTQALLDAVYVNDAKKQTKTVLEVGTGCGYQTAILAQLFETVYSIERITGLHAQAKEKLKKLGFNNIHCFLSDGSNLQKTKKFDAILITAAPEEIPQPIIELLAKDGCLISPEGLQVSRGQKLIQIKFDGKHYCKQQIGMVDFVPLLSGVLV